MHLRTLYQGALRGPLFVPAVLALAVVMTTVRAATPEGTPGTHDVYLVDASGERTRVGTLDVEALDRDDGFAFRLDEAAFGDYFLSMRPFRCIARGEGMLCHLAYPYENRRRLSRDDLTDLEYDLLFVARSAKEYGIDPWNGRYWRLHWQEDAIIGTLHETDLNVLAAPPPSGDLRPLADADMIPVADGDAPTLRIEPR